MSKIQLRTYTRAEKRQMAYNVIIKYPMGTTISVIAKAFGVSPKGNTAQSIRNYIRELEEMNLVRVFDMGRELVVKPWNKDDIIPKVGSILDYKAVIFGELKKEKINSLTIIGCARKIEELQEVDNPK